MKTIKFQRGWTVINKRERDKSFSTLSTQLASMLVLNSTIDVGHNQTMFYIEHFIYTIDSSC